MENEFLKMMPREQILKAFDEMMDFVKSDSPTAIDYLREIRNRYAVQPEIVLCKDCKFHGTEITQKNGTIRVRCKLIDEYKDGNWFCADGERAE